MFECGNHSKPVEGAECMVCFDDISEENYVEYKSEENSKWLAALSCQMCIEHLIGTQFARYGDLVKKTTCKAELGRLLKAGPPINLKESQSLPCPDDGEVFKLWFSSDKAERSAKLKDSLVGEERLTYWNSLKAFWSAEDEATKDEDD